MDEKQCPGLSRQFSPDPTTWFRVLTPHQRSAWIQQTFIEHLLCARPVKRGNLEREGGGKERTLKRNKNEKKRVH